MLLSIDLAHCLSGGLPRDLLRVARRLSLYDGDARDIAAVARSLVKEDLVRKVEASVVSAQSAPIEPHRTAVQFWMRGLAHVPAGGASLRSAADTLPPGWSEMASPEGEQSSRVDDLDRLREELATFVYFLATVLDFFAPDVRNPVGDFAAVEAPGPDGRCALDHLARARAAFAVNPGIARAEIDAFRRGRGWDGDAGNDPGEGAARVSAAPSD